MKIKIPNNYINERKYIVSTIITDFLGFTLDIEFHDVNNYTLILPNNKEIIINDNFFSNYTEINGYLHESNIPTKVLYVKNKYIPEKDIPVIYGNDKLELDNNRIICGIDIFASSFFMLTRWEEYVIKEKDKHNRFQDKQSLAYKNNFHKRPVVNEYTEMLWNIIKQLDSSLQRKQRKYAVSITHDVDEIRRYNSLKKYIKAIAGDLILRKNPLLWFKTTYDYLLYNLKLKNDPYDTFDYLMNISEKNNLKSHFYFMPNKLGEIDARYDVESNIVRNTIKNILKRDHVVGIHGSYDGYNKENVFNAELNRLKKIHNNITEGRQHYLRFANPITWQQWNNEGLEIDSTIGYTDFAGFRSGVCYEYKVFNILSQSQLQIIEKPLIAMEGALKYEYMHVAGFLEEIGKLSEIIKKYKGNFVFLWHNNNLKTTEWQKYSKHYENIISLISH